MFYNFIKVSLRNLQKHTLSSFINVTGLAVAIGTCMVAYSYLTIELTRESQHTKGDSIYMLTSKVNRDGTDSWFGIAPAPIGPELLETFPQVKNMTRIYDQSVVVSRNEKTFNERTRMADPAFLQMFDFEVVAGNGELTGSHDVIINNRVAEKYFGQGNPVGEKVVMRFGDEPVELQVVGVVSFRPMSTSYRFTFLTNYQLLNLVYKDWDQSDWSRNITATFIEVDSQEDVSLIKEGSSRFIDNIIASQPDWQVEEFGFEVLSNLYYRSKDIRWDISREADTGGTTFLIIVSLLMLALACVNYLNIAISSASRRLKEIALRKVIGGTRKKLVTQFMIENLTLSAVALIMGTFLGILVFIPGFNGIFGISMYVDANEPVFYLFLAGVLLITAIASGAYPAIFISRYQPAQIFRGSLKFGKKNMLTKSFLTVQYVLACVTVLSGILGWQNARYQRQLDWGYSQQDRFLVQVDDSASYQLLKQRLEQEATIKSIASSAHHLGIRVATSVVETPGKKLETRRLDIGVGYIETMGLRLKEGRSFQGDIISDQQKVVVNESFVNRMGWDGAVGQLVTHDSAQYQVIGVLEDFHYDTFYELVEPAFLRLAPDNSYRYLVAEGVAGSSSELFARTSEIWASIFPDRPYSGRYQKDLFNSYFDNLDGQATLMAVVGVFALGLSCFGLFGLVALNVAGRAREFSIRKVLGANTLALVRSVGSHFYLLLAIALAVGAPLGHFGLSAVFDQLYAYHQPITILPVIAAVLAIMATIILTLGLKVFKVVTSNPTEGLRTE